MAEGKVRCPECAVTITPIDTRWQVVIRCPRCGTEIDLRKVEVRPMRETASAEMNGEGIIIRCSVDDHGLIIDGLVELSKTVPGAGELLTDIQTPDV